MSGKVQIRCARHRPELSPELTFCFNREREGNTVVLEELAERGNGDNTVDGKSSFQVPLGTCLAAVNLS